MLAECRFDPPSQRRGFNMNWLRIHKLDEPRNLGACKENLAQSSEK
jgi:hypothetical protein